MMMETAAGCKIDARFLHSYLKNLVKCCCKVRAMEENEEESLPT